jgi:hypothetical protein
MKSSWHSLNSFLAISAAANSETSLDYCCILRCTPSTTTTTTPVLPDTSYTHFARTSQKTRFTCQNAWRGPHRKHYYLYCCEGMFTEPLPSNRSPIFSCTCVPGMCLAARRIAMDIHVTILCSCRRKLWFRCNMLPSASGLNYAMWGIGSVGNCGSTFLRNIGIRKQDYTASQPESHNLNNHFYENLKTSINCTSFLQ